MPGTSGRRALLILLVVLVAGVGGLFVWKRGGREQAGGVRDRARGARASIFASDPDFDNQKVGAIEGSIVDAKGEPVAAATIVLTRTRNRDAPFSADYGRVLDSVKSDGGGHFAFSKVHAGAYAVTGMAEKRAPGGEGPVVVGPGETKRVNLRLGLSGYTLTGRVFDVGGGAISGAKVRAMETAQSTLGSTVPRVFQAVTDETGMYRMYLGSARYGLLAEADGYAPAYDWVMVARDLTRDLRMSPAARISGRVIERGNKKPVPDAELWLLLYRAGGMRPRDVKTDEQGVFSFNDLEPGTYRVGARKGRLVGMSTSVSVALAQSASDVEIEVDPGFIVAGRVVGPTGQAVASARIQFFKDQPPFERPMFTKSEPDGSFRFEGVLPAEFRLDVKADGFAQVRRPVKVTGDVPALEIKLAEGAAVRGRVASADGKGVEDARIQLEVRTRDREMGGAFELATAGKDGTFEVSGLPPGDLLITAQHESQGIATLKDEKLGSGEQKTVTLRLEPGASISGKVLLDDGKPAAGARVEAQRMGGGGRWNDAAKADGTYRLSGLPAGSVIVVAANGPGTTWTSQDRPDQKTVTVAEREQKTGVDLVVAGGKTISGVVVGPDGKPVSGVEITAGLERDGRAFRSPGVSNRAYSVQDGSFTIEQLGAGKHTLWAVLAGFSDGEVKGVEGGTTGVQLRLAPESTVAGTVVTPDGKPISDYSIVLADAAKPNETIDEKRERQFASPWQNPTDTVHDPSGRFFFPRVPEGARELRVRTADGGAGTLTITVAAGERKEGIRLVVQRGVRIKGKVVEYQSGQPLGDVDVRLMPTSSTGPRPFTRSDAGGAFVLEGVAAGEPVRVVLAGDRSTHGADIFEVDVPAGSTEIDMGTARLFRGDVEKRMRDGSWDGLTGMNITENGKGTVLRVRPGMPAEKAGIKAGDTILAIDGTDMRGMSFSGFDYYLRGRPGSPVTMMIQTPGEGPRTVTFNRYDSSKPLPAPPPRTASK